MIRSIQPCAVATTLLTLVFGTPVHAAHSVEEDFSGPTISPWLQADPVYQFDGAARNTANMRRYIRTVDADYVAADFTCLLTYTVPTSGYGEPIVFFGVGEGTPCGWFWDEPLNSVYLRNCPNDFPGGSLGGLLNVSINNGSSVDESRTLGFPGGGTHRARITKSGDLLTLAVDVNSSSGPFAPDYTQTLSLSQDLPFLNSSNSRLFFGTLGSTASFDDLIISVPEPASSALMAAGLGCWTLMGTRRRKAKPGAEAELLRSKPETNRRRTRITGMKLGTSFDDTNHPGSTSRVHRARVGE